VWAELKRQEHRTARCTVTRLMRNAHLVGAVGGKQVITTMPDPQAARAADLIQRTFVATAPNRCLGGRLHARGGPGRNGAR
jgi:putative transposase